MNKIIFCGDTLINWGALKAYKLSELGVFHELYRSYFSKNKPYIILNLEGPLLRETPIEPSFSGKKQWRCQIYSPSHIASSLKKSGVIAVSLANNHIFDYGYDGFKETIEILQKNGIGFFGAGENIDEARKPYIIKTKDSRKIAILGYAWSYIGSIYASKKQPGTAPLKKKVIVQDIHELKKEDVTNIIILLHWGYEGEIYPAPRQRILAHAIIDKGASAVIGHHPHVIQGIEIYKEKPIYYSLGNFVFPDIYKCNIKQKEINKIGLLSEITLTKNKILHRYIIIKQKNEIFIPYIINNSLIHKYLSKISKPLKYDIAKYRKIWKGIRIRKDLPDTYNIDILINIYRKIYKFKKYLKNIL